MVIIFTDFYTGLPAGFRSFGVDNRTARLCPEVMHRSGADGVVDSPGEQRGGVPALRGPGLLRRGRNKGIRNRWKRAWKSDDITISGYFRMIFLCYIIYVVFWLRLSGKLL